MARKQSSSRLSRIAGKMVRLSPGMLKDMLNKGTVESFCEQVRSLAASVLAQDETPGDKFPSRGES